MAVWRTIVKSSPDVNLPFPTTAPNPALWAAMPVSQFGPKPQVRQDDAMVKLWATQPYSPALYEQDRIYPPVFPKLKIDRIPVPETTLHWATQPYSPALYEQNRDAVPPIFPKLKVDRIPVPETTLHWAVQPYSPAMYEQVRDSLQPGLKKLWPTQIPPADDYGNHFTPFVPIPTVSAYDSPAWPPLFPRLKVDRIPPPDIGVTFTPYKPTVPWEAPIDMPQARRAMQSVRQEDIFTAATVVVLNTSWNVSIDVPMQHVTMVRRPEADQQVPVVTRDFGWSATFVMPKVVARSITQIPADLYIAPPLPGNTPDYGWTPMHKPLPGKRNAPEFNVFAIDNAIQTRPITGKTVYLSVSAENRTVSVPAESRTLTVQSEI